MHYRSVADLNATILANLEKVPRDVDLVVGVPRSGLLAANLLALHLNLPLTDVAGLLAGRIMEEGRRRQGAAAPDYLARKRTALVVDDSLHSGTQMRDVKRRIQEARLPHAVIYAVVYVNPRRCHEVDIYFEALPSPRIFEWNLLHNRLLSESCVDIDGVLCRDPTEDENDDGEKYQRFLTDVPPLFLPTQPVGWLVTSRLEKYRQLTEAWLARHRVAYGELLMLDVPNKDARLAARLHASFKASAYRSTNAVLFIESSVHQALEIARLAGKPVFSMETRHMVYPAAVAATKRHRKQRRRRPFPARLLKKLRRSILGS